jgi:hypothetical protein
LDLLQLASPGGRHIQTEQGEGSERKQTVFHSGMLLWAMKFGEVAFCVAFL